MQDELRIDELEPGKKYFFGMFYVATGPQGFILEFKELVNLYGKVFIRGSQQGTEHMILWDEVKAIHEAKDKVIQQPISQVGLEGFRR